jgi:hypothetical protein
MMTLTVGTRWPERLYVEKSEDMSDLVVKARVAGGDQIDQTFLSSTTYFGNVVRTHLEEQIT